jgi:hypothetical protein
MNETFATIPVRNSRVLCIGSVTRTEARDARASGLEVDPSGHYLFLASASDPSIPIEILARFFSAEHAERAADLLPASCL